MKAITITSYNIHKGMSPLNRQVRLGQMATALATLGSDVLCLQEVQGQNLKRIDKLRQFADGVQHQWFAQSLGAACHYGKNAQYPHGHHGNAVLSHYPLHFWHNLDISVNRLERRGVLHCQVQPDGWAMPVIVLCCHLNLRHQDRIKQYRAIGDYIAKLPPKLPLILAGDFNDWSKKSCQALASLGMTEVFGQVQSGQPATFPAKMPILSLDRIYVRGLAVQRAMVHDGVPWSVLSDHLPISAVVSPLSDEQNFI
ncbi:endonuclease/exonuclease/phosphatase family protein [Moraxella marmotae]|uniref:endonuclease/exonuclease/phosphatase family protein n=1 Tax=Moraxella marmotae TaxID=3344520 RepID=UPI0035F304FE